MQSNISIRRCPKEKFIESSLSSIHKKEDSFAKTFIAKANMQEQWDDCLGAFDGEVLLGAIIVTISKRKPHVANLQLLHTFYEHRNKGIAKLLCDFSFNQVKCIGAEYIRVSSEIPAITFYEKIGFKFLGKQKSGCQLSICKLTGNTFSECDYDINDPIINKAVYKKGKGGCVEIF